MEPDLPSSTPEPSGGSNPDPAPGDRPAHKRPKLDPNGMERPVFLLDYPEDPELERLISAFESGNYALVRRDAEKLAATTENDAVRAAALELRRRIDPDPLAKYLLAIAGVLLLFLILWAYRNQAR